MPIKVFISHKQEDAAAAAAIEARLKTAHRIDCYLDVLDPSIGKTGEELARYVRDKLSSCTQLLAVVTAATKESWWVPWEIGVASEKEYPLATYGGTATLPDFLKKWPVLRSEQDLDAYARASLAADRERGVLETRAMSTASVRQAATREFYRSLRASLGQ